MVSAVRSPHRDAGPPSARVGSLNIWFDVDTWPRRLEVLSSQIAAAELDVLCLQEAVVFSDGSSMAASLARRLGRGWSVAASDAWYPVGSHKAGLAVLSRLALAEDPVMVALPGLDMSGTQRRMMVTHFESEEGFPLVVANTHLAWGAQLESLRAQQVFSIDRWFSDNIPLTEFGQSVVPAVLCGDFNSEPHADSLRFLRGEAVFGKASTFWVDAWLDQNPKEPGFTSSPANAWASEHAARYGVVPPRRRVDFVFSRGFVHGRPGRPLRASLFCDHADPRSGLFASDHFGVYADIALS